MSSMTVHPTVVGGQTNQQTVIAIPRAMMLAWLKHIGVEIRMS